MGGGGCCSKAAPLVCANVCVCVCVFVCVHDSFEDITSISDYRPVVSNGMTFGERRTGKKKF